MHDAFSFTILWGLLALSLGVFIWYVLAAWRHWRQVEQDFQEREERYRQWVEEDREAGFLDDNDAELLLDNSARASRWVARHWRQRQQEQQP
ncbi:hypothetical protein [Thermogemmatispora onikobensis]|uniref:hypothetical protein n=1 Tax=Thermogemmatispora onikobensis TaxID=732234 RepID=UPI000853ACCE|nr:hypothetical protein [Thermogemmatispora onikobensis]